jgi:hypothetical protein
MIMRAWMHATLQGATLMFCLAGCQHAAPALPTDPILISKKPIFSKPQLKPPEIVANSEPAAPPGPVEAVAVRPKLNTDVVPVSHTLRGQCAD